MMLAFDLFLSVSATRIFVIDNVYIIHLHPESAFPLSMALGGFTIIKPSNAMLSA